MEWSVSIENKDDKEWRTVEVPLVQGSTLNIFVLIGKGDKGVTNLL